MNDPTHLKADLRATREELLRIERNHSSGRGGGLTPNRDPAFRRLATLSAHELELHIERLERDLEDLDAGPEAWDNVKSS